MSDRHGVEIDYRPKCRGVWLDRGELDKNIERATAAEAPVALCELGRAAAPPDSEVVRPREMPRRRDDDDDYDRRPPQTARKLSVRIV